MPDPTPPGFYDYNLPPMQPSEYSVDPNIPPSRPVTNLIEIFLQASAAGRNGFKAVCDFHENRRMTRQGDN